MALQHGEILIDDGNFKQFQSDQVVRGERKARGAIPRDYTTHPENYFRRATTPPSAIVEIPESEWEDRIREMEATKSRLSDIREFGAYGGMIPSLDQNGQGFCWKYSGGSAQTILRASMNLPYVRLSMHAGACKIKNFRDEGGWGAQGLEFDIANGAPSVEFWPEKSMSRQYDNAATWANAKLHRITEDWADLANAAYDRSLTFKQVMSCLLARSPVIVDYNWWSHSVCAIDPVMIEKGSFGVRIWNSWSDSWSDRGMGVLRGTKAIPDGAVAPRAATASIAA